MKYVLIAILLIAPHLVHAQQGMIVYERVVTYDFEVPDFARDDDGLKEGKKDIMLLFNNSESVMQDAPVAENEASGQDSRNSRMMAYMKMNSASRSDNETIEVSYINRDEGILVEVRDFMTKEFRIESDLPVIPWKLDGEEGEFLGYTVHKATAKLDTTSIEAWFALDIPYEVGPESYGGLPGAILVLSVNDGQLSFTAKGVSLDGLDVFTVARPERGEEITREKYERTVADKIEELKRLGASRDRSIRRRN